jgi:hypothetical protein
MPRDKTRSWSEREKKSAWSALEKIRSTIHDVRFQQSPKKGRSSSTISPEDWLETDNHQPPSQTTRSLLEEDLDALAQQFH